MDPMDAIRATFFEECNELLESLEAGLLALQSGNHDADTIDAVFRAVHSIKGGAGAFGLDVLVRYTHGFETVLDALRAGRIAPSPAVIAVFLRASDTLGDVVAAAVAGEPIAVPDTDDLQTLLVDASSDLHAAGYETFSPVALDLAHVNGNEAVDTGVDRTMPRKRAWIIAFEPLPELLTSGNEPLFLFRALEVMGALTVEAIDADLASLVTMDTHLARLRWRIRLVPSAPDLTETEIEAVFEFAVNLCVLDIRLEPVAQSVPARIADNREPSEPTGASSGCPGPERPTTTARASTAVPDPRATYPTSDGRTGQVPPSTIRVDLERVDRLVNLVGELVISQSMLMQGLSRARLDQESDVSATLDGLQQLTRDMQDSVMAIRAQPVKSLFQRMTRIVREAAQATGKDVRLDTAGESTEIDKTVVERLAEPLTHMIRNAIDHGLESPEARASAGKSNVGIVRLTARQQSDRVVIEVSDDGCGIDRPRVLARAVELGLVPDAKALDEAEIDRLLFLPGFSTSTSLSALSGRGVGMDVVQRAIRDLSGTISITSAPGRGCTISISLPLTLAILDGMIVRSGHQRMVIPLSAILETQTYASAHVEALGSEQAIVRLHDRYVPLLDLARSMGFAIDGPAEGDEDTALLFVQRDDSGPFALRVDAIEAQRQVVIKGLGTNFGHVPCVSAATILGNGEVALIVDPAGIATMSGLRRPSGKISLKELVA